MSAAGAAWKMGEPGCAMAGKAIPMAVMPASMQHTNDGTGFTGLLTNLEKACTVRVYPSDSGSGFSPRRCEGIGGWTREVGASVAKMSASTPFERTARFDDCEVLT